MDEEIRQVQKEKPEEEEEEVEKGVIESVGDLLSSSAVTVKEAVLSNVSVVAVSADQEAQSFDTETSVKVEREEISEELKADKGVMESVRDMFSDKGVMESVGDMIPDHAPETDEASMLINSIVHD